MDVIDLEQRIEKEWGLISVYRGVNLLGLSRSAFYQRLETRKAIGAIAVVATMSGMSFYNKADVLAMKEKLPRGRPARKVKA